MIGRPARGLAISDLIASGIGSGGAQRQAGRSRIIVSVLGAGQQSVLAKGDTAFGQHCCVVCRTVPHITHCSRQRVQQAIAMIWGAPRSVSGAEELRERFYWIITIKNSKCKCASVLESDWQWGGVATGN